MLRLITHNYCNIIYFRKAKPNIIYRWVNFTFILFNILPIEAKLKIWLLLILKYYLLGSNDENIDRIQEVENRIEDHEIAEPVNACKTNKNN